MAALISSVMSTKDKVPVLRQPLRRDGDRGAAARRQRVRPRLRRLGQEHPLRPRRGQERRPLRRPGDPRRALEDGEFTSLYDFCERVDNRAVNKRAVECLIKCGALDSHGRLPQGDAGGAADGGGGRPEGPGGLAPRPGLDLRPRRRRGRDGLVPGARAAPADRPRRSSTSGSCCALEKETLGTYLSSHPLAEVRDALRARVDCSLSKLADQQDGGLGDGRRDRHRVQAPQVEERRR